MGRKVLLTDSGNRDRQHSDSPRCRDVDLLSGIGERTEGLEAFQSTKMRSALKRHPTQRNYLTTGLQVETGLCPCVYEVLVWDVLVFPDCCSA
jgi:hypothetical protein